MLDVLKNKCINTLVFLLFFVLLMLNLFYFHSVLTVVHVKIVSEAINELSLDTSYRVRVIHVFKMSSSLATFRSIWILSNLCHCPLLLPGKQYLLMGQMSTRVGSTKIIAEISRESYVEEWKRSMKRRMPELGKKRCPVMKTTQMSTLVRTEPESTAGIKYITLNYQLRLI